jgi:uncharacterized membrane protein YvbJ
MFCGNCGKMIEDGDKFCTECGTRVEPINIGNNRIDNNVVNQTNINENYQNVVDQQESIIYNDKFQFKKEDKSNILLIIVGLLFPIVGLILFLVLRKDSPKKANSIGIASLVGIVIYMIVLLCLMYNFIYKIINKNYYNNYDDYYNYYDDYDNYDDFYKDFEDLQDELNKFYQENIDQSEGGTI